MNEFRKMQDDLQAKTRAVFGDDIKILVARAVAFGSDDNCLLVMGSRHAEAARAVATVAKGAKIETMESALTGMPPRSYSAVVFGGAA